MYHSMKIAGIDWKLPLCKVSDELYIGAFVMMGAAELTVACAKELLERAPEYDYLITAEAKGIPLIHEMARQHKDEQYIVARKVPKLYMTGVFETEVQSITTKGTQKLYLDTVEADMMKGKRVLIVDDVISTGESLRALEILVEKAGGKVVGKMTVLAEGEAQEREDIISLEKLPVFNPDDSIK